MSRSNYVDRKNPANFTPAGGIVGRAASQPVTNDWKLAAERHVAVRGIRITRPYEMIFHRGRATINVSESRIPILPQAMQLAKDD
jgi:hypothetical protein